MQNKIFLGLMFALIINFSSCLYTSVVIPATNGNETRYNFSSGDFTILGRVEASGSISSYLWAVSLGGAGYFELLDEAKKLGGDDVMNVKMDIISKNAVFLLWQKTTWKASGFAIKYTKIEKPEKK